jgi:hypothetical protein
MFKFDAKTVVKEHVAKHKKVYRIGSYVVVAGVSILVYKKFYLPRPAAVQIINNVVPNIAPVFNNDNSSLVNLGGHTTKMVKRLSDDKIFEQVTDAAREAGCSVPKMSRHLNGHNPHVYEEVYKIIGVGTTG